jgi:hypothetical protein
VWAWVAEAGGGEAALRPSVVDAGAVPVNASRGGVAIELVAHIDQVLYGRDVDVVYGGEVENDGSQDGTV